MDGRVMSYWGLTKDVVSVLAEGEFPTYDRPRFKKFLDDIRHDRVLAVMEYPTIDIELEIYTANGCDVECATHIDNSIAPSYFVCIKGLFHGKEMWESYDFAGDCYVDFNEPDWEEELKQEMDDVLEHFASEHGLSFTSYNFEV